MKNGSRIITVKGFSSGDGSKYFPEGTRGTITTVSESNSYWLEVELDNYKDGKTLELINEKAIMNLRFEDVKELTMVKDVIRKLANDFIKAETQLKSELEKLENGKSDCICDNPEYIPFVEPYSIATTVDYQIDEVCLNCGGSRIEE